MPSSCMTSVPADCIEQVASLREDKVVYQRMPTPRPAPNILLKNSYDHFTANESTRHAKKKQYSSITDRWQRGELCRSSQIASRRTEECGQYLDSPMSIDFSHAATRKGRARYGNNLLTALIGAKPGPMMKRADYPQAVNKLLYPHTFAIPTIEEEARLERQWKRWRWKNWSQSSSSSSTWWTRMARIFFALKKETQ